MGFFSDKADSVKDDIAAGRTESAADSVVHALLEGGGTHAENLDALAKAVEDQNNK